jgi:hypothetical protein
VPFVGFWHVFEMPLLGYLGYGPFAWEMFALFWFAASLVRGAKRSRTLRELEASVVEAPQEPLAE